MRSMLAATLVLLIAGVAHADVDPSMTSGGPPITPPARRVRRTPATPTTPTARQPGTYHGQALQPVGADLPEGPTAHAEGDYGGVAPDHPHSADSMRGRPRHVARGTLGWIGFEAKDGGAEVFFQSGGPFTIVQSVQGGNLVVTLAGLTRQVWNTRRTIDTRYFDNPLAAINAHPVSATRSHPSGIEVRLTFKNPKDAHEAQVRTATEADGMFYTYLSFGEGADQAGTTPPPSDGPPTMANPEQ